LLVEARGPSPATIVPRLLTDLDEVSFAGSSPVEPTTSHRGQSSPHLEEAVRIRAKETCPNPACATNLRRRVDHLSSSGVGSHPRSALVEAVLELSTS
jgi:hypothetical protein